MVSRSERVQARRDETRREILDAAWTLADTRGLDGMSLQGIAAAVGMQAPSLYSYFPSKAAILDALFIAGYREADAVLAAHRDALPADTTPAQRLESLLVRWITFCQERPARYRLMYTAAIPGWHPSADAFEASVASYEQMQGFMADLGVTRQDDLDLYTALAAGLVAQQMANDPEGDRWSKRVSDAVAMFLLFIQTSTPVRESS